MEIISIRNLTTGYPTRRGFVEIERDLNATLHNNEFTCLLGPNGAGKSTLLKTLAGYLMPIKGQIMIDGTDLRSYSTPELARKIAVVLTERPETVSMTVEQLVAVGRSPYTGFWGRLKGEDEKNIKQAMETTGVLHMAKRTASTLSDGERQKVMIAKALAQSTPIILLDEPTAFLDFPSKVETMVLLKKLARDQGKTIFMSTHDVNMALQLADNIWLVDKNIGVVTGTPKKLAESGDIERYFKGPGIKFNRESISFSVI